jgi:hypothetical protein
MEGLVRIKARFFIAGCFSVNSHFEPVDSADNGVVAGDLFPLVCYSPWALLPRLRN